MDLSNTILTNKAASIYSADYDPNKIYYTNKFNNPYKIIGYDEPELSKDGSWYKKFVTVQFLETGTIKHHIQLGHATRGAAHDEYAMNAYNGNGCIGNSTSRDPLTGKHKKEFKCWKRMMERVYSEISVAYKSYGAKGITVDERWKCYENFEKDLMYLDGYREWKHSASGQYHLDKDLLQQGLLPSEKIYSPFTTAFVPAVDNEAERTIRVGFNSSYIPKIPKRVMCVHRPEISIADRYKYHKPKEMCRIVDKGNKPKEMCRIVDKTNK